MPSRLSSLKSLAELRRPQAAEKNKIVFPGACTSEKHFAARSVAGDAFGIPEARHRAETPSQKSGFATFLKRYAGRALALPAYCSLSGYQAFSMLTRVKLPPSTAAFRASSVTSPTT